MRPPRRRGQPSKPAEPKKSNPTYTREKLGNSSGIKVIAPSWGEAIKESFGFGHIDERLIGERQKQIEDQFTDVRLQSDWAEFKKDWGKDGYFTRNNEAAGLYTEANCPEPVPVDDDGKPKCFQTSEDWPDSVKDTTVHEAVLANYNSFRNEHNAVLRTYEHFKMLDGAVRNPYAIEGMIRPRCYDDPAGNCPEWGKTFKQAYEGELPDDIRDLDGEGLDRFNRFMFQEAQEETIDLALGYTDFIPFTGALLREVRGIDKQQQAKWTSAHASIHHPGAEELAYELDAAAQGSAILGGVEAVVDGVTFGAGGYVIKGAQKLIGAGVKAASTLAGRVGIGVIATAEAGADVAASSVATGTVKAGAAVTTDIVVKAGVTLGETAGKNVTAAAEAAAIKAGLESGTISIEEALTTTAVRDGAEEAIGAVASEMTAEEFASTLAVRGVLLAGDVTAGTILGNKCAADDDCWRFDGPYTPEPVINHLPHTDKHPNETVTYNDDLYYSTDPLPADAVTGGSSTAAPVGTGASLILVLMAGGAVYYLYRKLT